MHASLKSVPSLSCGDLFHKLMPYGFVIAKFHYTVRYTGPTGPDQTKSADFVGDPGLRPGSREKVRVGPCGSGPVGPV